MAWQFAEPTHAAKEAADRAFLNNMLRIVFYHGGFLTWIRAIIAVIYYLGVRYFGGAAFWDCKKLGWRNYRISAAGD